MNAGFYLQRHLQQSNSGIKDKKINFQVFHFFLTLYSEKGCGCGLPSGVSGHHFVEARVLRVGLVDEEGAAVPVEEEFEVTGLLDWLLVMVPNDLRTGLPGTITNNTQNEIIIIYI